MVTDSSVEGHEHAAYLRSDVNATMNKAEVAIVTDDFGGVDIKKTTSAVEDAWNGIKEFWLKDVIYFWLLWCEIHNIPLFIS